MNSFSGLGSTMTCQTPAGWSSTCRTARTEKVLPGHFSSPPSFPRFCVDCFISPDRSSLFPPLYLLPVSRFHSHPFLCCPGKKEEKEFAAASFKGLSLSQTVPRWLAVKLLLWMHVRMLKRSMPGTCGHKSILFGPSQKSQGPHGPHGPHGPRFPY